MSESLRVPGRLVPNTPPADEQSYLRVTTKHSIAVQSALRGNNDFVVLSDLPSDDLIEAEFENGVRVWTSVSQFQDDLRKREAQRGSFDPNVLTVPTDLYRTDTSRGGPESLLKRLTHSSIDFSEEFLAELAVEPVARLGARELVRRLEAKLKANPGLYRLPNPLQLGDAVTAGSLQAGAKILLFIHGTASSTQGSFSDLSGTPEWDAMRSRFKDSIVALEHKTLSETPIDNAIQAATQLPDGATLNIVSHSRGGLVGELLCLTNLTDTQLDIFERDHVDQRQKLQELTAVLRAKNFKVERFVRVACPSRGTLLASKRLDLYLSVLLNLFGLLPVFQNPFYKLTSVTLKKIIAMRADPSELPGLEAQMPESGLIHLLNRPDLQTNADLAVIAGDSHGGGIFQALGTFALDVFYRKKHDFVVNTDAMYGGIDRSVGGYYFDHRGRDVCHFHYFKNETTRQQINAWLAAKTPQDTGAFAKLAVRNLNLIFPSLRGQNSLSRLVFVPGLLGTHLKAGDGVVWLDWSNLLPGSLDALSIDRDLQAGTALSYPYDKLLYDLNTSHSVTSYPYDWRKPITETADALASRLQDLLQESSLPVYLVTAFSGALVLQTLVNRHTELWKSVCERRGRAVMLGSPASFVRSAGLLTTGKHRLIKMLSMIDRRPADGIGRLFAALPGVHDVATFSAATTAENTYWISGRLEDGDAAPEHAWFAPVDPGTLADAPFLANAVRDLLASGTSDRLDSGPGKFTPRPPDVEVLYPTEQELLSAAFESEEVTGPEAIRIHVKVTHGHLRDALYPVVVGHYLGDGIVSAEQVLDQQLKGKLSENFHLDIYPGAKGTSEVIESPNSDPPGALIIGLGQIGGINAEVIRRGVTAVAIRYALTQSRQTKAANEYLSLGVSSVLLGTYGGNALTVRESVAALVDGIIQANLSLRANQLWSRVRIEHLEFIEIYEDLAVQATHELLDLQARRANETAPAASIDAEPQMNVTSGGLFHRPLNPYRTGWWRRVLVEEVHGGLKFTILTERASTDLYVEPTQRKLITHCVDQAVSDSGYKEDLARILFELLLPPGLKEQIKDRTNLVFVVSTSTAHYPWEMLAQGDAEVSEPMATRIGLIRQLTGEKPPVLRNSRSNTAAVIGNSMVGGKWPALPKVKEEIAEVTKRLKEAGYQTKSLADDKATARAILSNILKENRILHLSGHGHFDEKNPQESGIVIGDGLYLSAAEIGKIEPVPELVFLNCCYSGQILPNSAPNRLAASIAEKLIEMGVKAIVASGWAVEDTAARQFATVFYDAMLQGTKFGEAVLQARVAVYRSHPQTNTWGAYQCYGNPDFALELNPVSTTIPRTNPLRLVARREVLEATRSIRSSAVDADDTARAQLLTELSALDRSASQKFNDGEVLSELASTYAALGDMNSARQAYEKAFIDPTSKTPLDAAEQLVNLLYREAEEISDEAKHLELIKDARDLVDWTLARGRSVERLALKGSLYKREAKWLLRQGRPAEVRPMLEAACNIYTEACNPKRSLEQIRIALADEENIDLDLYPALNVWALQFLLSPHEPTKIATRVPHLAAEARIKVREGGSFWHRAGVVDASLLMELSNSRLAEREVQLRLKEDYLRAFSFASKRQKGSVLSQLAFLRDMTAWAEKSDQSAALGGLIKAIEDAGDSARRSDDPTYLSA